MHVESDKSNKWSIILFCHILFGLQLKLKKSSELAIPDNILAGIWIDPSSNTRSRM
jgi:hypothetical protein